MTDTNPQPISSDDLADKFSQLKPGTNRVESAPTASEIQSHRPIERGDFVSKFSELQGGVEAKTGEAKGQVIQIAAAAGLVVTLIGFLLGMKRGKGKSTVVEIRRV